MSSENEILALEDKRYAAMCGGTSAFASCGHNPAKAYRRLVPLPDLSRCSNVYDQTCGYSITSSARASSIGGTVRPRTLAA